MIGMKPYPAGALRCAGILLAGVTLWLSPIAAGAQPSYTIDKDPIRLGAKAWAAGDLDEAKARFMEAQDAGYQPDKARLGLARIAVRRGRYPEAEVLFRDALRSRSGPFPEARAELGLLLLRTGKSEEARKELDLAAAEKPDLWEAAYGRALLLIDAGKWDEARALLDAGRKLRGLNEGEDQYHYGLARLELAAGNTAAAETAVLLALSLNPSDPDYALMVARTYEATGSITLAINAYQDAMATPGAVPTAPALHTLGRLYQKAERYTEARDTYVQAYEADSTYAPVVKDLADLLRLANQNDRAARAYARYTELEPRDVDGLLGLAASATAIHQTAQALDAARRAFAADSLRADVRAAYAAAALRAGDAAEKRRAFAILTALPDSIPLSVADGTALGDALKEEKRYAEADRAYRRALNADPGQADTHAKLALNDLAAGRPDSAVVHFERAIALQPDRAIYHLNLGIARFQNQDVPGAIPSLRRAVAIDPDLTTGRLLLAQVLATVDSLSAAEVEYGRILEAEPGHGKALKGIAYCRIKRADYDGAASAYQRAAKTDPDDADAWAGLGNAFLGLQKWSEAGAAFDRARAIDPKNPTLLKGTELLEKARGQ